jgi:hypothetical protein
MGEKQKPFLPSPNPPQLLKKHDIEETFKMIWKGSFPEIVLQNNSNWDLYYASYSKLFGA